MMQAVGDIRRSGVRFAESGMPPRSLRAYSINRHMLMNVLVHPTTRLIGAMLLIAFGVAGCRTYGGYGSSEDMLGKIQQATQRFAEDYERAQGERDALQRAAGDLPALAALAERFAAVVERQGALVEEHRTVAEQASAGGNILFAWVGPDTYRRLHRTYGALISDQQIVQDRYAEVLRDLQQAVGGAPTRTVQEEGRYQVAPHFYNRIEYALAQRSVADILAQTRAGDDITAPAAAEQ